LLKRHQRLDSSQLNQPNFKSAKQNIHLYTYKKKGEIKRGKREEIENVALIADALTIPTVPQVYALSLIKNVEINDWIVLGRVTFNGAKIDSN